MSHRTKSNGTTNTDSVVEETLTKLMPNTVVPPLLPPETTPPHNHIWSSTRTLRPRPPRPAVAQNNKRTPRKRVHMQEEDVVHEQQLPCKRGKTGGRNDGTEVGGSKCAGNEAAARIGGVRTGATGLGDVVVKEEVISGAVGVQAMVGAVGSCVGGGMAPTRDSALRAVCEGDDAVKVEVKREVKREVKEESGDNEDGADGEYYDDDEDDCGSGDTDEDSDVDTARVKTEMKREVKEEGRRDVGEGVAEDVSRGTVQLTATQSDTRVGIQRNPWVCATNPHGFTPATLARLQELSPEAREKEVTKLLKQQVYDAKRRSDPALRQRNKELRKEYCEKNTEHVKQQRKEYREKNRERVKQQRKEYREKNKEKVKQRKKEYREKNKEKVKQRDKEWYEKNKDQINTRMRERRARKKAEREAVQRVATGDPAESV